MRMLRSCGPAASRRTVTRAPDGTRVGRARRQIRACSASGLPAQAVTLASAASAASLPLKPGPTLESGLTLGAAARRPAGRSR